MEDYGTLRPGDIEASDIEATTLRPGDIEARRHWGQATLRPGDIEARRLWGQICMSNFPKPKHWPQSRDFEANVWPRSRDDVEARQRWGQICMGNYPKERMGYREHIYCTNVQKMQSLSKWKKITSRKCNYKLFYSDFILRIPFQLLTNLLYKWSKMQ